MNDELNKALAHRVRNRLCTLAYQMKIGNVGHEPAMSALAQAIRFLNVMVDDPQPGDVDFVLGDRGYNDPGMPRR